jgi:hypothetical protein
MCYCYCHDALVRVLTLLWGVASAELPCVSTGACYCGCASAAACCILVLCAGVASTADLPY